MEIENIPNDYLRYYITGGGRIAGLKNEDLLDGDAQRRRELLGNSFMSAEEASYAKCQMEAWARLKDHAICKLTVKDGKPVIEIEFDFTTQDGELMIDARMVAAKHEASETVTETNVSKIATSANSFDEVPF